MTTRYTWGALDRNTSAEAAIHLSHQARDRLGLTSYPIDVARDVSLAELLATTSEVFNVKGFGATGDGTTDDTAAFQAALDSAFDSQGSIVYLPPGHYSITQIRMKPGVSLIGAGIAPETLGVNAQGSVIEQVDGQDVSAIVNDPTVLGVTDFWHWSVLSNFRLIKKSGTDTLGSGIELNTRTGEGFKLEHLFVSSFPEDGISFLRGGIPLYMEDIHVFGNGAYGVDIGRTGSDTWQIVSLNLISGDDNQNALIRIITAGAGGESFFLSGIKGETATAGKQLFLVELDNTGNAPVVIENISGRGTGGVTGTALVRILNSAARVVLRLPVVDTFTNFIKDESASASQTLLAATTGILEVFWDSSVGRLWQMGSTVAINSRSGQSPAWLLQLTVAASNGLVVRGASAQSGSLQRWENNAGAALSRVGGDGAFHFGASTALTNTAEGNTGAITQKTTRQVVAMGTGSTAVSTSISVPSGARLIAVALNVDVAIVTAGDNTWGAAFSTGSTTTIASAGRAATQNTKISLMLGDEVTSGVAEITFTPNGATFTSGNIEAVVWYEEITALANA